MPQQVRNEIVRSLVLEADRDAVWNAISSTDGLEGWLAESAIVDLRPGGEGVVRFAGGHERLLRIAEVDHRRSISFDWSPAGSEDSTTRVELTLEDAGDGATRITVSETGFPMADGRGPGRLAAAAWAWDAVLMALAALVVLVAVA